MKPRRILFPTDFSPASKAAELTACQLAGEFQAELHVVHVLSDFFQMLPKSALTLIVPEQILKQVRTAAEESLTEVPPFTGKETHPIKRAVLEGTVHQALSSYAREHLIDLIVIGTHGRSGLSHALIGSVAEKVSQYAPCAVLLVPSRSTEAPAP